MKATVVWMLIGGIAVGGLAGCSSKVEVPPVTGLDLTAATAKLQEKGLTAMKASGELGGPNTTPGAVLRQSPEAGQKAAKGSAVQLVVDDSLLLPSFTGLDLNAATALAESQRLRVRQVVKKYTGQNSLNSVLDQMPAANTRVMASSFVDLTVEDHIVVPDLIGTDAATARTQLEQAGLRASMARPRNASATTVASQSPKAGARVRPGSLVEFKLDSGLAAADDPTSLIDKTNEAVDKGRDAVQQGRDVVQQGNDTVKKAKGIFEDVSGIIDSIGGHKKQPKDPKSDKTDRPDSSSKVNPSFSAISLTPKSPAQLLENQVVQISFNYVSSERQGVIITASPLLRGMPLPRVTGEASHVYSASSGKGLLAFTVATPGAVADEVHLEMRAANDRSRLICDARLPVHYQFVGARTAGVDPSRIVPKPGRGFPLAEDDAHDSHRR